MIWPRGTYTLDRSRDWFSPVFGLEWGLSEGLLLLTCGLRGNIIRLLPPLTITDEELARGLQVLERALR